MKDSSLTVFKDIGVKGLPGLMICLISRTVFTDLPCDHQHICYALCYNRSQARFQTSLSAIAILPSALNIVQHHANLNSQSADLQENTVKIVQRRLPLLF